MTILALEFSSAQRSVAVLAANTGGAVEPVPIVAARHASPRTLDAFQLIETALGEAGLQRDQIDCVAVGLGPGSYTGIRAAISIAQGWDLARGIRLLGIGSVECLALQAQEAGIVGRVSFVIDAQRNEFYLAACQIEAAHRPAIEPLRLASFDEVSARAKAAEMLVGPEMDGRFPNARLLFPNAAALARLAATRTDFVAGENLQPIYLRETSFVKAPPPRILPAG